MTIRPELTASNVGDSDDVADLEAALHRLDNNRELLHRLIQMFREDGPQLCGEIESALSASNAPAIKQAAHSLKGLAANFGAERVCAVAMQIERNADQRQLTPVTEHLAVLRARMAELYRAFDNRPE